MRRFISREATVRHQNAPHPSGTIPGPRPQPVALVLVVSGRERATLPPGGSSSRRRLPLRVAGLGMLGRLEPAAASLSGCRRSGLDSGCTVVSWAYVRSARFSYLVVSCAYTRGPRRSRANVGPTLGPGTQLWGAGFPRAGAGKILRSPGKWSARWQPPSLPSCSPTRYRQRSNQRR
jgi:hypothetical protein